MRVRGIDLAVEVTGPDAGTPLLWGHALMGSVAQENEAAMLPWRGLPARGIRLVRWDARGHGRSEASLEDRDYRWPELARDLWAVADALALDSVVLGGISMGAATALHAAVQAPHRTLGVVLMAPPTAWESRPRQARIYRGGAELIDYVGLSPFRWLGAATALTQPNRGLAALQRSVMGGLRAADARGVRTTLRGAALSDLPARERIATLDMPVLILAWTRDPSHPLSTAEALAELLPRAELCVARSFREIDAWSERVRDFAAGLEPVAIPA